MFVHRYRQTTDTSLRRFEKGGCATEKTPVHLLNFFFCLLSPRTRLIAFNCPQLSDIISDHFFLVHRGRKWPHFLYSYPPFLSQKAGPKSFITKCPLHVLVTERSQSSFSLLLSFFFQEILWCMYFS